MSAPLMVLRAGGGGGGGADGGGTGTETGWGNGRIGSDAKLAVGVDYSQAGGEDGMGRAGATAAVSPWWGDVDGGGGAWAHLRDPSRVVLRPGQAATGPNEVLELCRQNKGSVYCVDAAADASLVASGGTDRMIRLLDPRAGGGVAAKICKLDGHGDNVRCVKIDEGGTRVVGDDVAVCSSRILIYSFVSAGEKCCMSCLASYLCGTSMQLLSVTVPFNWLFPQNVRIFKAPNSNTYITTAVNT